MFIEEHCRDLNRVAYKSCIYSYGQDGDKSDIQAYLHFLVDNERYCEAEGVKKAIELITLYEDYLGYGKGD